MFIATTNTKDDSLKQRVKNAQQKQVTEVELWCNTQGVKNVTTKGLDSNSRHTKMIS